MSAVSPYPVEEFATRSVAAAGQAAAELACLLTGSPVEVQVDPVLAYGWFGMSFTPDGWQLASPWDSVAGDYRTQDGWIRLHTNAPHHRAAALAVLGLMDPAQSGSAAAGADRAQVTARVLSWTADRLEDAVLAAGGCAAVMKTGAEWDRHPQGIAVAAEPLIAWHAPGPAGTAGTAGAQGPEDPGVPEGPGGAGTGFSRGSGRESGGVGAESRTRFRKASPRRPLAGVRVLDLTRVIAGPVATRFLAGLGADVLRLDPPHWNEPALEPEMTLGKRRARLDAAGAPGRALLQTLAAEADIVVHGYRPGALAGLGLSPGELQALNPGVVDVGLDAYGWSGTWAGRRGFDSLVQMSAGIAAAGMVSAAAQQPVPLPVQALDHATGYLAAAAALRAWTRRVRAAGGGRDGSRTGAGGVGSDDVGSVARLSLARTATALRRAAIGRWELAPAAGVELDREPVVEHTDSGPGVRLPAPLKFTAGPGLPAPVLAWDLPAGRLGLHEPAWAAPGEGASPSGP